MQDFVNSNKSKPLTITSLHGKDIHDAGLELAYAVGKASKNDPIVIHLTYNGATNDKPWLSLVGKGVCFDAGGLNI